VIVAREGPVKALLRDGDTLHVGCDGAPGGALPL